MKSTLPDAGHLIRNRDGLNEVATGESIGADGRRADVNHNLYVVFFISSVALQMITYPPHAGNGRRAGKRAITVFIKKMKKVLDKRIIPVYD